MAYDNTEIEIKIQIDESDFASIRSNIQSLGKLKNSMVQIDTYFAPKSENYLLEKYPFKWFSIRQRNGKSILNFKHFFPEGAEKHSYCKEFETEISNSDNMKSILNELGIFEVVEVDKTRETYLIDDKYEIVFDVVKGLGSFLEIEAMKNLGSPEETKKEMMSFLGSIGVVKYSIDYRGYPFQLLKQQGKI